MSNQKIAKKLRRRDIRKIRKQINKNKKYV